MPDPRSGPLKPPFASDPGGLPFTIALSGLAGWVDATGFLHSRGLFVSFMSGNTTALGVVLSGLHWGEAARPASVLAAFVSGVAIGGVVGGSRLSKRRSLVLFLVAAILAAADLLALHGFGLATSALLAIGMGVQSAAVHRVGSATVAVTYVTGNLVNLGRGLADGLTGRAKWREALPFGAIWLGLLLGASIASLVAARNEPAAFLFATGLAAVLAVVSWCLADASSPIDEAQPR